MEEHYYYKRKHHHQVPAFGSWDWNENLPFTQCFESATQPQPGFIRYNTTPYSVSAQCEEEEEQEQDLYVTGDLYQNDLVTPAMIVVPRRKEKVGGGQKEKQGKKENYWVNESDMKEPPSPMARATPKPVDEDLYKISPELLYAKTRKKRGLCFFPSCLLPACIA